MSALEGQRAGQKQPVEQQGEIEILNSRTKTQLAAICGGAEGPARML
jgi:hypothetical protein